MALVLLAGFQIVVLVAAALMWRRLRVLGDEVAELRALISKQDTSALAAVRRRTRGAEALHLAVIDEPPPRAFESPLARAARLWRGAGQTATDPTMAPETLRGILLAVVAMAPALGFFVRVEPSILVAIGLFSAACMMLLALRRLWRAGAWAGVITASAWALLGFTLTSAHESPALYAIGLTLAGAAGLAHAHLRAPTPGATLALAMSAATLALGSQIGLAGPAGCAFLTLTVCAAIFGALTMRRDALHFAAFGGALIGLFVLSGQPSAAIWFTPAASWAGALFFAIAVIRVPQLGPRGLAIAGTGALAPLAAIMALHASRHGLADPNAAAGALVVLSAALVGLIALSALRRERGLAGLKLTLWVLAGAAFAAFAIGLSLATPPPISATAFAGLAVALLAFNAQIEHRVWRALSMLAATLSLYNALAAGVMLLGEARGWPTWALIAFGGALPGALCGLAAHLAHKHQAKVTAALLEVVCIALTVASASLVLRTVVSGGALMLTPISFAEAGLHVTLWLVASLVIAGHANRGATSVRLGLSVALSAAALLACFVSTLLWLTPHWTARAADPVATPLLSFEGLGYLAPALLAFAHWVFWRARGANLRTRVSLGASALMLAALVTLETVRAGDATGPSADWLGAIIGAFAFALAISVNFAPGVTLPRSRRTSYFEENLNRHRRRQVRVQSR